MTTSSPTHWVSCDGLTPSTPQHLHLSSGSHDLADYFPSWNIHQVNRKNLQSSVRSCFNSTLSKSFFLSSLIKTLTLLLLELVLTLAFSHHEYAKCLNCFEYSHFRTDQSADNTESLKNKLKIIPTWVFFSIYADNKNQFLVNENTRLKLVWVQACLSTMKRHLRRFRKKKKTYKIGLWIEQTTS